MVRKKTREEWTEKHRNVARISFGRRLVGQMKESAKHVTRRKAQKSKGQNGTKSDEGFQRLSESGSKKRKLQSGKEVLLRSERQWNRGHFSMKKWESEMHKSWGMPAEAFKGHVATDGSLLGTAGKWGACGWSVVQLDYDGELGPLHGMYGSNLKSSAPSRGRN